MKPTLYVNHIIAAEGIHSRDEVFEFCYWQDDTHHGKIVLVAMEMAPAVITAFLKKNQSAAVIFIFQPYYGKNELIDDEKVQKLTDQIACITD